MLQDGDHNVPWGIQPARREGAGVAADFWELLVDGFPRQPLPHSGQEEPIRASDGSWSLVAVACGGCWGGGLALGG